MEALFLRSSSNWMATLATTVASYVIVVALLRLSGKRTLSSWNSFDFVVTVAFGSTLATVILNPEVSVLQGALAFAALIALQFGVTWLSVRSEAFLSVIKARPTLLAHEGELRVEAMKRARVNRAEIFAALRANGFASLKPDVSVVLETDGEFSVVVGLVEGRAPTLEGVRGYCPSQESTRSSGSHPGPGPAGNR